MGAEVKLKLGSHLTNPFQWAQPTMQAKISAGPLSSAEILAFAGFVSGLKRRAFPTRAAQFIRVCF